MRAFINWPQRAFTNISPGKTMNTPVTYGLRWQKKQREQMQTFFQQFNKVFMQYDKHKTSPPF